MMYILRFDFFIIYCVTPSKIQPKILPPKTPMILDKATKTTPQPTTLTQNRTLLTFQSFKQYIIKYIILLKKKVLIMYQS